MSNYPRVVYMITHNVTKRMYIGSTKDFDRRIKLHLNALRSRRHTVEDMQKDFDDYGENYSIKIIGEMKATDEVNKEYELMNVYNSRVRGVGYNYKDNHGLRKKVGLQRNKRSRKPRNQNIYPNIRAEFARKGFTRNNIVEELKKRGINMRAPILSDKLTGKADFTLGEAKVIKEIVGTDLPIEVLFEEAS